MGTVKQQTDEQTCPTALKVLYFGGYSLLPQPRYHSNKRGRRKRPESHVGDGGAAAWNARFDAVPSETYLFAGANGAWMLSVLIFFKKRYTCLVNGSLSRRFCVVRTLWEEPAARGARPSP